MWDAQTFQPGNSSDSVTDPKAFIEAATVMQLHQDTGAVLAEWGKKKFLMPHGLTVDTEGNVWVTDVALHQAIKFSPEGKQLLALGVALEPGSDTRHFCKPTHVRIATVCHLVPLLPPWNPTPPPSLPPSHGAAACVFAPTTPISSCLRQDWLRK